MKRLLLPLLIALSACTAEPEVRWPGGLRSLSVQAVYPEGFAVSVREGAEVKVADIASGAVYSTETDSRGTALLRIPSGVYRISVIDRQGSDIFAGTIDRIPLAGTLDTLVNLKHSKAGSLVIKELYVGGCSKAPQEGTYQSDQYVILHNNDSRTMWLDSLCFGTLSPYNATGVNHWRLDDGSLPDFVPVVTVVWRFPGDGKTFPLEPGQDALIALRGAIDHTAQYPLSVNLNRSDCFVCYDPAMFPNPIYHPAPGDKIRPDHILKVVIKTGQSNANVVSVSSPTFVIFKAQGTTIEDWVLRPDVVRVAKGNSADVAVTVPQEWILDAVEVFDGSRSGNNKRLSPALDAGFVVQSESFKSHSLLRLEDENLSRERGFTVLRDNNNSTEDFIQTDAPTLRNN